VKLTRISKDCFVFQLGRHEKQLLLDLVSLYPCIQSGYLAISRSGDLPDKSSSQKLLDEALMEQRAENQRRLKNLLADTKRWAEQDGHFQLSLNAGEIDWLLQVFNDIRVGSWVMLGSPEERFEVLNEQTAPHLWAMEMSGFFQRYFLEALEGVD
jgi:hypothetical protein